jgi:hypothetical protein
MRSRFTVAAVFAVALVFVMWATAAASAASFGLTELKVAFEEEGGTIATQAGGHPGQLQTSFGFNTIDDPQLGVLTVGSAKDLVIHLPPGTVGDPTATPRCTGPEFAKINQERKLPSCPDDSAVGIAMLSLGGGETSTKNNFQGVPLYNLVPGRGEVARLGLIALGVPVTIDLHVSETAPYEVTATLGNISQAVKLYGSEAFVWGNPESPSHDALRGSCVAAAHVTSSPEFFSEGDCPSSAPEVPFLTSPRACSGPLAASFAADSWQDPGAWVSAATPASSGFGDCASLGLSADVSGSPTTTAAESSSGLDFNLNVEDPGLKEVGQNAQSDIEKAVVTLPEGVTTNPAVASGLSACTLAQYEAEKLESSEGCPEASKIGTVEIESPLLEEEVEGVEDALAPAVLRGRIYVGHQHDNVFDNLLTIYMVIEDPKLGIFIKLPGRVEPNSTTGQLTTTFGEPGFELPQLPFSHFRLHFRSGNRAPLITPPTCGTFATEATLYPYATPDAPVGRTATFTIGAAAGSGSCVGSVGQLPNSQSFAAGTLNSKAGSYSPFILKLAREDGTQQLRSVSATLPAGLLGKLAGIPYCSDSQIAQATARSGEGQGAVELGQPSCPQSSEVGSVTVGAGAGSELLYVNGRAYLAGPYRGAPLSLEIVTPAIAGPFDLGVVAVRTALSVNPITAQITAESDPIPTILHGLPLDVRSIAIEMNRPDFTINPTNCEPMAISGSVTSTLGSTASLSQYFQASECRALKFAPKLQLTLKGATKRAGHPALKATLTYPKGAGYSNVARAQVSLPHSEFLDQGNLSRVCTQPQLKAAACPAKSVYGKVKAWTPLLEKPLEGNVYLAVGFGYKLPALVAELNGQIRVLLVGKVDTDKQKGIRNTFEAAPDAPVEKFILELKGGPKYGLLENSENICHKSQKAGVAFKAQNGKTENSAIKIANSCKKPAAKKRKPGNSKPKKGNRRTS